MNCSFLVGYERDNETSLDFAQARYFSNIQGRFTSPDEPLYDQLEDEPQSWNLYSYVRNNPLNKVDPTGRETCYYENGKLAGCDNAKDFKIDGGSLTVNGKQYELKNLEAQMVVRSSGVEPGHQQNVPFAWQVMSTTPGVDFSKQRNIPTGNVPRMIPIIGGFRDFADSRFGGILLSITPVPEAPILKFLHKSGVWQSGTGKASLEFWKKQSTEKIIESLKPGAAEALRVKPDGTIMNGNTRIKVLQERGVDVNSLPREPYR